VSSTISSILLEWYDRHRRTLPWRAGSGERAEPYRVWLSEIMLQQTTVAAVKPYFATFLERWPTVDALAAADLDAVLRAWAGLGYYARARNLHACAKQVSKTLGGRFPEEESALRALPGVGPYTAAAIAAIAYDRKAVVMDGNVERVMARLFAETAPLPGVKPLLKAHAAQLTPAMRCGDYAQAVMDLGATICTPRSPSCAECPLGAMCQGREIAAKLPTRAVRAVKPTRRGIVFWTVDASGRAWVRRRPETGLLGGMMEFPSTPWREAPWSLDEACAELGVGGDWRLLPVGVRHTFSHFHLELDVALGGDPGTGFDGTQPVRVAELDDLALPSLMRKVVNLAKK